MTPEQQKAFERRLDMCSSEAWAELIEELDEFVEVIDTVRGVKTVEELFKRQGKLELCDWIKSIKETSELTYQQFKDDDATTD
jgi:hypothetical protein